MPVSICLRDVVQLVRCYRAVFLRLVSSSFDALPQPAWYIVNVCRLSRHDIRSFFIAAIVVNSAGLLLDFRLAAVSASGTLVDDKPRRNVPRTRLALASVIM